MENVRDGLRSGEFVSVDFYRETLNMAMKLVQTKDRRPTDQHRQPRKTRALTSRKPPRSRSGLSSRPSHPHI